MAAQESECGWCKDHWGFSWQITPRVLLEGNTSSDKAAAKRAFEAMMTMQKIDVAKIEAARRAARPSMRKLTGAVFVSLDGVMQAPGGPEEDPTGGFRFGGWVAPFWDEDMGPFEKIIMGDYDLLLGKRTYDIFAGYWPYNQDDPIGAKFQRINKYVLTHSDEPLAWENSHKLSGDTAADAVAELKQSDGRDLLIQGSSTLYPPLLSAGLIDRLVLMTFPVLLGKGKSIFDGAVEPGEPEARRQLRVEDRRGHRDLRAGRRGADRDLRDQGAERGRARAAREDGRGQLVTPASSSRHPFSSYCQKVLIALWADGTTFDYRMLDQEHPENMDELKRRWPFGQFPCWSTTARRWSRRRRSSSISRRTIPARTAGSPMARPAGGCASSTASSTCTS